MADGIRTGNDPSSAAGVLSAERLTYADMQALVGELREEQGALEHLLAGLDEEQWLRPTPAQGWDVRDSVAHLAATDELALRCITGDGERALAELIGLDPDAVTRAQADRGLGMDPTQMLAWWRETREQLNDALEGTDPDQRVPWGAGPMAARSFATARLMECWAHALDCFAAVGVDPVDTDRLRHVCHLAYRALPYAFRYAGMPMPAPLSELRIELDGPGGEQWRYGPPNARQSIRGSAGEWARVAVQRMCADQARTLVADGALAARALKVARAYF